MALESKYSRHAPERPFALPSTEREVLLRLPHTKPPDTLPLPILPPFFPEGGEDSYFTTVGKPVSSSTETVLFFDPATTTEEQREYAKQLASYYEAKLQTLGFAPWDGKPKAEEIPEDIVWPGYTKKPKPIRQRTAHDVYTYAAADDE